MATEIIGTDEFRDWFWSLDEDAKKKVAFVIEILGIQGTALGSPYSSEIKGSKHGGMRELRTTSAGDFYRVLYIFDPKRNAVLLVGGVKTGKGNSWYTSAIRLADRLYDEYLMG
ncbi:MAG TPA: type II toxin-antitoxin system RelE/ParE family toxin [Acidobacteriaceae bacterium]|nr:type II toxin-antitoxin system RelE/ParE family toxin [Acidobacteriaceae bacterium]